MKIFKIKKGGETENVDEALIVLSRPIDDELIKKAINICAENDYTVSETVGYLEEQFGCVELCTFDNVNTFYC